jgi:Tol biopolymer transport system component
VAPTDTVHKGFCRQDEEVFVMNADGTGVQQLTTVPGNDHWPPTWSPDGRQIVYTSDPVTCTHDGNLMTVDVATREVRPFLTPPCECLTAAWRQ